jgi:hypothetical protein
MIQHGFSTFTVNDTHDHSVIYMKGLYSSMDGREHVVRLAVWEVQDDFWTIDRLDKTGDTVNRSERCVTCSLDDESLDIFHVAQRPGDGSIHS